MPMLVIQYLNNQLNNEKWDYIAIISFIFSIAMVTTTCIKLSLDIFKNKVSPIFRLLQTSEAIKKLYSKDATNFLYEK